MIQWLDANNNAVKSDYENKLKEIEKLCAPAISKLYGTTTMPGTNFPAAGGPTVEEVD